MATAALNHITLEEYLALEQHAEFRSEYLNGRVIAMTGAEPEHADIVFNVGVALRTRLPARRCRVFLNDLRTEIESSSGYVYPDVVALCGEARFEPSRPRTLLNPHLVVEVLSESTRRYDRGEKFAAYREVASLTEYVLVDPDRVHVERYVRHGEFWTLSTLTNLDELLELSSLGCALPLREIYANVEFSAEGMKGG